MSKFWIILVLALCLFIIFLWSPWEVTKNFDDSSDTQVLPSSTIR